MNREEDPIEVGLSRKTGWPAANRGSSLPRDRAGHRIQPLFQHGDAGVQPVAIAVEGIDGGRQPPRLVLAFLGDRLDLLRLPHQIGGGDLFAPQSDRRLIGQHRHDDSTDRANAPRSEPPQRSPVEFDPPRPKSRSSGRRYLRSRSCGPDCRNPSPCDFFGPPEPRRITRQTLTGNPPPHPSRPGCAGSNRVSTPAKTLYDGGGANPRV